jgi:transcriptional regulator with XRE-family HTH domain
MYDRTALREAAARRGDTNSNRVAIRLGVGRMTAHRLWNGTAAPSAAVAAAVHRAYKVPTKALLIELEPAA